jgi:hypothetical protein
MEQCFGAKAGKRRHLARALFRDCAMQLAREKLNRRGQRGGKTATKSEQEATEETEKRFGAFSRRYADNRWLGSKFTTTAPRPRRRRSVFWRSLNYQRADRGCAAVCVMYSVQIYTSQSRGFCGPPGRFFLPRARLRGGGTCGWGLDGGWKICRRGAEPAINVDGLKGAKGPPRRGRPRAVR